MLLMGIPGLGGGSVQSSSGIIQLAASNYVGSEGIALSFVNCHADANCGSNSPHRNAYPGIEFDHKIGVHGGAYPYYFEVTEGPTGLSVGSNLTVSGDAYGESYNYGRLSWNSPTTGSHTVSIRVTDQAGTQITRSWTLVVGTANWVFVDPVGGSDAGTGLIGAKYQTLSPLSSHTGKLCYINAGTVTIASNFTLGASNPSALIGVPGETVNIAQNDAWFVVGSGADDCMLKNLTIYHNTVTAATEDRKCISQINDSDRLNLVDLTYTNYEYGGQNAANGAVFSSLGGVNEDQFCSNWSVSGDTGTLIHIFKHRNALYENINAVGAAFNNTDSSSSNGAIRLKDGWADVTIRSCELWDTNTWPGNNGGINAHGQDQSTLGIGATDICYNKIYHPSDGLRDGALIMWSYGSVPAATTDIHVYRNSFSADIGEDCYTDDIGVEDITAQSDQANIFQHGSESTASTVTNTNNLDGTTVYFDSSLNLTGEHRTNYLGTRGAEVA